MLVVMKLLAWWAGVSVAMLMASPGCGSDARELEHGYIKFEFRAAQSEATSPFPGTSAIRASMTYDQCLREFYDTRPAYQADGIAGEPVFSGRDLGGEGWLDRLCDDPQGGQVDCTVDSIGQNFQLAARLSVLYSITGDVEGRFLKFGPLPTAKLAACSQGTLAQIVGPNLVGQDAAGDTLWTTASTSTNIAFTDQGAAIVVLAERS